MERVFNGGLLVDRWVFGEDMLVEAGFLVVVGEKCPCCGIGHVHNALLGRKCGDG